ncbi:uncharacterized protein HHUB_4179 (plasmid) [Halobacterium hubeiense]|uniref:Uncharacterized protein n=1 Tax=Halobacterium hubeiense TaxID=1407499 RepID=A0A0U5D1T1_9EURY|nr:uncharacterized protein HHUB_4179 [Halobacterium hubeiense]
MNLACVASTGALAVVCSPVRTSTNAGARRCANGRESARAAARPARYRAGALVHGVWM